MYVVLDLETTGLDYTKEQIIEIAAVKIDDNFNEIERFHTLVSLDVARRLPPFITKLTGITEEDLEGEITEYHALSLLREFIGDLIVVAQNAPFDLSFISRGYIEPERFVCTRALVRYVEPELSASLKDVCKRRGINLNGHHRAMNDVLATIEVLKEYAEELHPLAYLNVVLDEPNRPLTFVPNGAKIRYVYYTALTSVELVTIARNLPDGDLKKRLESASNRKGV